MTTPQMGRVLPFRPRRSVPSPLRPAPGAPVLVRIRMSLDDAEPTIWRDLDVRGDLTLDVFHEVVNRAMGWQNSHLHRFSTDAEDPYGTYFLTEFDVAEGERGVEESTVRVDQVLGAVGDQLTYLYDFGDSWQHTITVLSVSPAAAGTPAANCLDGRNAGPLEDCGGISGHAEILAAFRADPTRRNWPEDLRDWVPIDYDPEALDLDRVNVLLELIGATAVEIFEAFVGRAVTATRAPALDDILSRLNPPEVAIDLAGLAKDAATPAGGQVDSALAGQPWQALLDRAFDGGIPLTAAGWMKPDVVRDLSARTGLLDKWYGPSNREQNTAPLANLREFAQTAGLLRKYKDRLLLTKLGQAAVVSPDRLAQAVASGLLAAKLPLPQRHATVLYLLSVAAGLSRQDAGALTERWMLELRWMTTTAGHEVPLSIYDITSLVAEARHMLDWADREPMSRPDRDFGPNARYLARLALWPT
jgi:hypothetical protein